MPMTAKNELHGQITGCMRLSNIVVIKAKKPNMRVMSFKKHVNNVGTKIIAGGMQIKSAGVLSGIGMTTITAIMAITMMTVVGDGEPKLGGQKCSDTDFLERFSLLL